MEQTTADKFSWMYDFSQIRERMNDVHPDLKKLRVYVDGEKLIFELTQASSSMTRATLQKVLAICQMKAVLPYEGMLTVSAVVGEGKLPDFFKRRFSGTRVETLITPEFVEEAGKVLRNFWLIKNLPIQYPVN